MSVEFRKASRKKKFFKGIAYGPSKSGKTLGSLLFGSAFGEVALIDTQPPQGEEYADVFEYSYFAIEPPYKPEKLYEVIDAAIEANIKFLVIDSISHFWERDGGFLSMSIQAQKRGKNSFTAWGDITPKYDEFVRKILESPINIMCTARAKTHYDVGTDSDGRMKPQKVGMKPIQRDGIEYEFDVEFDISHASHEATITTRNVGGEVGELNEKSVLLSKQIGEVFRRWCEVGDEPVNKQKPVKTEQEEDAF